jgi:sulfite reductase (NADPH) flavoprotein alpha-component
MDAPLPLIPEDAPFSATQRAWLNGFFAGLLGDGDAGTAVADIEEFPWHDPALELEERLQLAEGKPLKRRLMAAMAQLDCGQCGYQCQTYAEALAEGRESSAGLCVPGAKPTAKMLKQLLAEAPVAVAAPAVVVPKEVGSPVRVVSAAALTKAGSAKDVRHVVIDLAGSGLVYEPGDSISVAAPNDPVLVEQVLAALGARGDERVPCPDGSDCDVRTALTTKLDIARPLDRTLDLLAMAATDAREADALRTLVDGDDGAAPADADLLDLIEGFPSAQPLLVDLVRSLPSLKPRLYSIASALTDEVHLCVSVTQHARRGRVRFGVASGFLGWRAVAHGPVLARVQSSHFRLPADPSVPVVMVGPGTGIAPFRAFLQRRASMGVRGRTWLFFGDQHRATDFLYEEELAAWVADGTLERLDVAFSRDQSKKLYVQDRMRENSRELWRWLQKGGCFYVCGDATRMARDVDGALRGIVRSEGGLDEAQARDWVVALARQGRYLRDVY